MSQPGKATKLLGMSPRAIFLVLSALGVAIFFYFAVEVALERLFSPRPWPAEKFQSDTWKATPREGRFVFCQDLIDSKVLSGLLRAEVAALLGQPDYMPPGEGYYSYTVKGRDRYEVSMNSIYFLTIYFDAQGEVIRYEIGAD